MSYYWPEILKSAAPVVAAIIAVLGIWVGAGLARRSTTQSFTRELIFKEIARRRELGVNFRKATWAFAARVDALRILARQTHEANNAGETPETTFNFDAARGRQEKVRDAFAELEAFSLPDVQIPARACMEALTKCFNACTRLDMLEADAQWATYQSQYPRVATELNREAVWFNDIIYTNFTPLWRAILRRAKRKPLPYEPLHHPLELQNPEERLNLQKTHPETHVRFDDNA
ncbi:hypothetical protein [Actinoplanes sp. NPDC049265]|uniref:hypothetical protein n=1 Tax=Actinoplanes sp. NPDC049265 TaxID=3363902 RepID=UPI0037249717